MVTFESLRTGVDKIAVVGLGYVGLPLAVYLSRHFEVVGYDPKTTRIDELKAGLDRTREVDSRELTAAKIRYTDDPGPLAECRMIIVAVPTPIDDHRIPDLTPLRQASIVVGRHLKKETCVVYESTVYPGATEEVCVPILEAESDLVFGKDFSVGYSPERINPGDRAHTLRSVVKIVSGSDPPTRDLLRDVYGTVVKAGVHGVSSIRVAEAAKVIENTQRDLNIALMNELAMIFEKMGIDTGEVLEAAGTKWNFLPFRPGLVGGHCIGVDPYYLTFKAEALGYHPEMILAGRRINDSMGKYVAERTIKMLINSGSRINGARVSVLGITFKEDVPDLRNSKVVGIVTELKDYGIDVRVHDPLADPEEAKTDYGIELQALSGLAGAEAVILAVDHRFYRELGLPQIAGLCAPGPPVLLDVKGAFSPAAAVAAGITYSRL
jgi:UDP-N-acetyl-D-glucosamine/UDP-N-acetyl-D-galactosamine dehydrogenase